MLFSRERLEDHSKPSRESEQTGQLDEATEKMGVIFVEDQNPRIGLNQLNLSIDFSSPTVVDAKVDCPELWEVCGCVDSDRSDPRSVAPKQFSTNLHSQPDLIQTLGNCSSGGGYLRCQNTNFSNVRTNDKIRRGKTASVDHQTDLGAFAFLGMVDAVSPFFPGRTWRLPRIPPSEAI